MGLSRKLGGGGGSNSRGASLECPRHIQYTWSTQSYTMREILTHFQLPCVVQCSGDPGSATVQWESSHFTFDLRQPLLLHAARTVRKVHARSLKAKDMASLQGQGLSAGELLEEFGPPLAIPEDYDGWFYPIGRHNSNTATVHTLPRHTRVEGAAAASPRKFLVTTPLPAFTSVKVAPGSGVKHMAHEVSVGEVLTKVGIVKGEPSVAGGSSLAGSIASVPNALMPRSKQTLKCLDENRHEVLIPFTHRALLYDVAENYGPPPSPVSPKPGVSSGLGSLSIPGVVHTTTVIRVGNSFLPRIFKHVLGDPPALADAFSGVLRCYSVFTEETVMAATMSRASLSTTALAALTSTSSSSSEFSSCLELATDSSARFNIALNASELKKTAQYALALKTCEEHAPSFVRAIKVSFTVHPVTSATSSGDVSDCGRDGSGSGGGGGGGGGDPALQLQAVADKLRAEQNLTQGNSNPGALYQRSYDRFVNANNDDDDNQDYLDESDYEICGITTNPDRTDVTVTAQIDHSDVIRDDANSVTTDAEDSFYHDTASMSDVTDGAETYDGASVSDLAEDVDANSEFDISWGELKRAQSFNGSLSSLTDSGTRSSCSVSECSDCDSVTEGSVVGVGTGRIRLHRQESSVSESTITRELNDSIASESTITRELNDSIASESTITRELNESSVSEYLTVPCELNDSSVSESTINRDLNDSNVSGSTTTRESTSSTTASEDTVVLRASAPSPIYVNVQKKGLKVFEAPIDIDGSSVNGNALEASGNAENNFGVNGNRNALDEAGSSHDFNNEDVFDGSENVQDVRDNVSSVGGNTNCVVTTADVHCDYHHKDEGGSKHGASKARNQNGVQRNLNGRKVNMSSLDQETSSNPNTRSAKGHNKGARPGKADIAENDNSIYNSGGAIPSRGDNFDKDADHVYSQLQAHAKDTDDPYTQLLPPDNSVRSVWNITPTPEEVNQRSAHSQRKGFDNQEGEEEARETIWWGDGSETKIPEIVVDSTSESDAEVSRHFGDARLKPNADRFCINTDKLSKKNKAPSADSQPVKRSSKVKSKMKNWGTNEDLSNLNNGRGRDEERFGPQQRKTLETRSSSHAQLSAQSSSLSHAQLSAQSSLSSSVSSLPPYHTSLSARSSVQSLGGVQDLAIQRLERALDEATNFLKSSAPPLAGRLRNAQSAHSEMAPSHMDIAPSHGDTVSSHTDTGTPPPPPLPRSSPPPLLPQEPAPNSAPPLPPKSPPPQPKADAQTKPDADRFHPNSLPGLRRPRPSYENVYFSDEHFPSAETVSSVKTSSQKALPRGGGGDTRPEIQNSRLSSKAGRSLSSSFQPASASEAAKFPTSRTSNSKVVGSTPNLSTSQRSTFLPIGKPQQTTAAHHHHQSDPRINARARGTNVAQMQAKFAHADSSHPSSASASRSQPTSSGNSASASSSSVPQADMDFVKTLGDKLMSVSRLSTLPKYQRLQPDSDVADDSSYDSEQSATPRALSATASGGFSGGGGVFLMDDGESDDSLEGELTPVVSHEDWDDRQDEQVV